MVKDSNAIVLLRQYHENLVICIFNFEDKPVSMEMESSKKSLFVLLDSSGDEWSSSQNTVLEDYKITVKPKSILLLSDVKG